MMTVAEMKLHRMTILTSATRIARALGEVKTLVNYNWGVTTIVVRWDEQTDTKWRLALSRIDMSRLLQIVKLMKVHELNFIRVVFEHTPNQNSEEDQLLKSCGLRRVSFTDCYGEFDVDMFRTLVEMCPKLESITSRKSGECVHCDTLLDSCYLNRLIPMFALSTATPNYRLRHLEIDNLQQKSMPNKLRSLFWSTEELQSRQFIVSEYAHLQGLVSRNAKGYRKCHDAIVQLLLIKRFRPESIFRHANMDVVELICQLIHDSLGTRVWCS